MPSAMRGRPTSSRRSPMVWAELPPVPIPIITRPGASSSNVRIALAVTDTWRVWGTVTPGPSMIRDVAVAQAPSVTHSSRHTRCVSAIQAAA